MSKNHKKICRILNCIEHFVILVSAITGCLYISVFDSLFGIHIGITSFVIELNNSIKTARIKSYKSLIDKKKKESW